MKNFNILALACSLAIAFSVNAQKIITAESTVKFSLENRGNEVTGTLEGLKGDVVFDKDHLDKSFFNVTLDANTINTNNKKRDAHLKNEDFFETETFATISFVSNKIVKKDRPITFISYSKKTKPEIQKIYDDLKVKKNIKMKSSLKFCVVASGEYDGYVAEPRAYEWDIAAGHAILDHSGGNITDFNGNEILYGKKDLKNPSLILKGKTIL